MTDNRLLSYLLPLQRREHMDGSFFGSFYLDKEKDIIVDLYRRDARDKCALYYRLRTPSHGTGNLITNLAKMCGLPLSMDQNGRKIIEGEIPCYIDGYNRTVYIFRLGNTKAANIYPDGTIEMKASVPAITKTLMSQTKDYSLGIEQSIVKTYIRRECKFRTDLHTHMNANLRPDILIALGICHQIRYPLYYIKKLGLSITQRQREKLDVQREKTAQKYRNSGLSGKNLTRRIDDNTFINFADLLLNAPDYAAENISKIRRSLAILKDGQAVFTNLEKVYLYRYIFTKGVRAEEPFLWEQTRDRPGNSEPEDVLTEAASSILDADIRGFLKQMLLDHKNPAYRSNTLFQDKLLWIARSYQSVGITYAEISDTTLVKRDQAAQMLSEVHSVMPAIQKETGVLLRFLAGIRRIPLTIIRHQVEPGDYFSENIRVLQAIADDPYVAGSDIIGEEINDIRDLLPLIRQIVGIAASRPSFVVRIHAGENDSLRDNVANSLRCIQDSLAEGQPIPRIRIGHGLYTANLKSPKGTELLRMLQRSRAVLEFQITSNVRLNNLSVMKNHPLRQYLQHGIYCVQGTDGGALYGTDSIDEQLALEKFLNLSYEEQLQMRESEESVLTESIQAFEQKRERWEETFRDFLQTMIRAGEHPGERIDSTGSRNCQTEMISAVAQYYSTAIRESVSHRSVSLLGDRQQVAQTVLSDRIRPFPADGLPVVIVGGSFNNDRHRTKLRSDDAALIDLLLENGDPDKIFFVVGHRLSGYERYLLDRNHGKFRVYAIIPALISSKEENLLRKSGAAVCVSIEQAPMGLYKSFAYELFKRRFSILLAFDGNSAGANMIQEAKNSRYKCRIYVSRHSRILSAKARSLDGYARLFGAEETEETAEDIIRLESGTIKK